VLARTGKLDKIGVPTRTVSAKAVAVIA
jgi:hypothetical protein